MPVNGCKRGSGWDENSDPGPAKGISLGLRPWGLNLLGYRSFKLQIGPITGQALRQSALLTRLVVVHVLTRLLVLRGG